MFESFLKYLEYEKRYSGHTIKSYSTDLHQFIAFLTSFDEEVNLDDAQHIHLRSWIITLIEDKIEARSVNRKIASLRAYYKYLLKSGKISADPSRKLSALKTPKKLPSFVKEDELALLLDSENFDSTYQGNLEKLIMELLYATGIRLSELIELKYSDIDLRGQVIKVLGKRNKERIIPLNSEVILTINDYIKFKEKYFFGSDIDEFLLVTEAGKKTYPMFIYRVVRKYLMTTSADKKNPHLLRHTFATHLLNKGADLNAVKDLLGHASLAATQVYTHNTIEKLKSVHKQAHPKA